VKESGSGKRRWLETERGEREARVETNGSQERFAA